MITAHIALVGDFSPDITAHRGINESLRLCREELGLAIEGEWLSTGSIRPGDASSLSRLDAIWCVPGSPYANTEGALWAIEFARTHDVPFLGTCGGFQHALMEFARNVLGLAGAGHEELEPAAVSPLISQLRCALVGKNQMIRPTGAGNFPQWFGSDPRPEEFHCRFGLNPEYEHRLHGSFLQIVARSDDGEVRAVELAGHPFFLGTLFQPERAALRGKVHPLVRAFAALTNAKRCAKDFRSRNNRLDSN
jgi:CTP synthase (UTP-ammonia lyase)